MTKMSNNNAFKCAAVGDRVTFNSDEGIKAGYVADLRRDLRNGEPHLWVEIDHQWSGMFQAVPVSAMLSNDGFGVRI